MSGWADVGTLAIWRAQPVLWAQAFGPPDVRAAIARTGSAAASSLVHQVAAEDPDELPPLEDPGIMGPAYQTTIAAIRASARAVTLHLEGHAPLSFATTWLRSALASLGSIREFVLAGPELGARAIGDALLVLMQRIGAALVSIATDARRAFEAFWGFSPSQILTFGMIAALVSLAVFGTVALSPAGQAVLRSTASANVIIARAGAGVAGTAARSLATDVVPPLTKWIPRPG